MTIQLTSELEARIRQIAEHEGKNPAELLVETAEWLDATTNDAERKIIAERLQDAERGDFLSEQQMQARFQKMLRAR